MKEEVWRDIVGYEGLYEVSSRGRVANWKTGRILKPQLSKDGYGYYRVGLYKYKKLKVVQIHTLVLNAFIGPPPPHYICHHKNGDNGDNRVENLEWISRYGKAFGMAKLSEEDIGRIRYLYNIEKVSRFKIAEMYGVDEGTIRRAAKHRSWQHVETSYKIGDQEFWEI